MRRVRSNEELIGQRFYRFTILEFVEYVQYSTKRERKFLCRCDCGVIKTVFINAIRTGKTQSCGCYQTERMLSTHTIHGFAHHPLYKIWTGIKMRCYHSKCPSYRLYGGRGIKMSKSWKNSVDAFCKWALLNNWAKGLEIDRIDNDGDYSAENCRIATRKQNCNNKRTNVFIEVDGKRNTISQWSDIIGVRREILYYKNKSGQNVANFISEALTKQQ